MQEPGVLYRPDALLSSETCSCHDVGRGQEHRPGHAGQAAHVGWGISILSNPCYQCIRTVPPLCLALCTKSFTWKKYGCNTSGRASTLYQTQTYQDVWTKKNLDTAPVLVNGLNKPNSLHKICELDKQCSTGFPSFVCSFRVIVWFMC